MVRINLAEIDAGVFFPNKVKAREYLRIRQMYRELIDYSIIAAIVLGGGTLVISVLMFM